MGYPQDTPMGFVAADKYESWKTRGIPKKGDVLFTTEAPLADVAPLDTGEKVAFAQRIIIVQPDAAKFDASAGETQRLAPLYSRKLAALEALKKSLLHQAFSGQLREWRFHLPSPGQCLLLSP